LRGTKYNILSIGIAASLLWLCSCSALNNPDRLDKTDARRLSNIDPTLNLNRDDYRNMATPKAGEEPLKVTIEKSAPPVPKLAEILAAPRPPKIGETQLVSIAVTDDVPLKDVLLELGKLADIDIELDAGISGGIEFIAKDKPFNEVIERIADLAGLRYTMKNGVLRVERDLRYVKSYPIDFLNMDRDSTTGFAQSTNVLSTTVGGSSGGGGSGVNSGSTTSVKSSTKGDFWASLEDGVKQILTYTPPRHVSLTTQQSERSDTLLTGAASAIAGAADAVRNAGSGTPPPAAGAGGAAANGNAASPTAGGQPTDETPGGVGAARKRYTLNRQAGVLTVEASSRQHELIERLLDMLKRNASAQVLIEAKIIEVDLTDTYKAGVDWQLLGTKMGAAANFNSLGNAFSSAPFNAGTVTSGVVSFAANNYPNDILTMLESFGTTRTLSSPRLHAINNQQATSISSSRLPPPRT
jgi:MSHA biogenesis protein MshL